MNVHPKSAGLTAQQQRPIGRFNPADGETQSARPAAQQSAKIVVRIPIDSYQPIFAHAEQLGTSVSARARQLLVADIPQDHAELMRQHFSSLVANPPDMRDRIA